MYILSSHDGKKIIVIGDVMPCSLEDRQISFREIFLLSSSTLQMETECSCKMLVLLYQNTYDHIPDDSKLHRCYFQKRPSALSSFNLYFYQPTQTPTYNFYTDQVIHL